MPDNMLYIHDLNHLTPKAAEIESVYLLREIRERTGFPLSPDNVKSHISRFFVSDKDIAQIEDGLNRIGPAREAIKALLAENDPDYEPIDLKRAIVMLHEVPLPMINSNAYAMGILQWQEQMVADFVSILNRIPFLKAQEEKVSANNQLNALFEKILQSTDFRFNGRDLVHEGPLSTITSLSESMAKGYFFHVSLEEELKKMDFAAIKQRISPTKLALVDSIGKEIAVIKKGAESAYNVNMQMVNLALVLYAYVKFASAK